MMVSTEWLTDRAEGPGASAGSRMAGTTCTEEAYVLSTLRSQTWTAVCIV